MADTNTNYLTKVEMDWEEIDRKVKLHRKKQLRRLAIIAACCVAGFAALYIGSQLKTYNKYKVINSVERTDTDAARFMLLDGKLLKYSNDGAFYTTAGNELIWNQTFEMQKPIVATCEGYVAFADENEQEIYVLNTDGSQGIIDTNMQIQKIAVARQGTVAALMKNKDVNYIALYNKDGECLAEGALHMENSGYPMDITLTSDGKKLGVSVLDVNSGSANTTVYFYNFDTAGQNEIDNIVNKCAYKDTVMAQLICTNGNRIIGFADNGIYIYDGSQKPEEKKVIPVSAEIKSVFYDDSYFGIVTGDEKEKTRRITVYDMSGSEKMSENLDISYDRIYFLENHEICIQSSEQCEIFTLHGVKKFQSSFEGKKLQYVMSRNGVRNYLFLVEGETEQIRCRFFSSVRK